MFHLHHFLPNLHNGDAALWQTGGNQSLSTSTDGCSQFYAAGIIHGNLRAPITKMKKEAVTSHERRHNQTLLGLILDNVGLL